MSSSTVPQMNYLAPVSARGDFASEPFITDHSRDMLIDAYRAVEKAPNGWTVLARPDVPGKDGFMFSTFTDPVVKETMDIINKNIDSGHSGASYGWAMRNMESIAKDGWANLVYAFRLSHLKDRLRDPMTSSAEKNTLATTRAKLERFMEDAKWQHQHAPIQTTNPVANILQQAQTVDTFLATQAAQNALANPLAFANAARNDPGMRAMIPDIDQQADAMTRFAQGKMSYAEMRSLCG
jgi:hypothetical protein